MRWWCLWTTWETPSVMATSRATPRNGGLMMPPSSGCGQGQGLQPAAQSHPFHLPISSPPAFQWCLLGAPPHAPLTPRGEGQAEMPGWPQDPLVPRLLPKLCLPTWARGSWLPVSLPWSPISQHQVPSAHRGSPLPLHYLFALLSGKRCDPHHQRNLPEASGARSRRSPCQAPNPTLCPGLHSMV